jgi:integrase
MTKGEANRGAVRRVKGPNGQVLFQAFLPRRYSTPPRDCASPESYQEPLGPRFDTEREARQLLNAALVDLREKKTLQHGLPLSHYVSEAIDAEHHAARRKYDDEARANTRTSTWRSIEKLWLRNEDFMSWPPRDVSVVRLRQWLNFMNDKALGQKGKPLSAHFVRNCVRLLSKAFDRVPDLPNPITALDVPEKPAPSIIHLTFAEQRRLFRAPESDVPLEQRIMIGCGMGSGLRVGELLAIEPQHVHLEDDDDLHLWVEYGGPNHAPTKSGQSRRVELPEALARGVRWLVRRGRRPLDDVPHHATQLRRLVALWLVGIRAAVDAVHQPAARARRPPNDRALLREVRHRGLPPRGEPYARPGIFRAPRTRHGSVPPYQRP